MRRRHVIAIAVLWTISLGAVAAVSAWTAQGQQGQQSQQGQQVQQRQPAAIDVPMSKAGDPVGSVVSGADIGFQPVLPMQPDQPGEVSGRWMVKIGGVWKVAKSAPGIVKTH